MNIHEHQAKDVLRQFGVPVPRGQAAFTSDEAVKAAEALGGPVWVVKSQIHAGGRGKGRFEGLGADAKGGVRVVKSVEDVRSNAEEMLGRVLVTVQTGPKGKQVNRLTSRKAGHRARALPVAAWSTERPAGWRWSPPPRAAGYRDGGPRHAREDPTIQIDPRPSSAHGRAAAEALELEGDGQAAGRILASSTRRSRQDMEISRSTR